MWFNGGYKPTHYERTGQMGQIRDYHLTRSERDELSFDDPAFDDPQALQAANEAEEASVADLAKWLSTQTWSEFAVSLSSQYFTKGSLSPKQIAAGESMRAKCEAKAKARAEALEAKFSKPESGIDLEALPSGTYGVPGGDTRLKVRINHVTKGRWEGWTFVDDGAAYGQRRNYGRQAPDATYQGEITDQLRAILADPQGAMAAYGHLTGQCGICQRHLEDEESVARGIGPVCAAKAGW